ncbi:ATP-binding protein [Vibrio hippocampi]|uniref:ATP-binding protein n=1 Tax=Vibrio hippocampi TaxID=654686 RepID=UPI003F4A7290
MAMMRSKVSQLSLKTRLLLAATLWLSAMLIVAGVIIPGLVRDYLDQELQQQLSHTMDEVVASLEVNKQGRLELTSTLSDPRFNQPYSGLYLSIDSADQVVRSRSLWDQHIDVKHKSKKHKSYFGAKKEQLVAIERTIFLPDVESPVHIIIGQDEDPIEATLQSLTGQLWVILAVLAGGILTLVIAQVSWSLRPLNKMQKELKQLKAGQRSTLEQQYPKEVAPLVDDLNALIFHYQELLDRARNHAGNLSHALKTPLSVLKNDIAHLSEQDAAKLAPSIQQIQAQIDYHLGRARMAGSMNILAVKASPSERVDAISMAFDKVYASRELMLISELDTDLFVAVEQADLDEMLGNLLENAYKWANGMIKVNSEVIDGNETNIIIEDDGPGIPEDECAKAIKRGVRLDESTPGTGLGLNIVSEMAHSYRGQLTLHKSTMGGLKAILRLHLAKE